MRFPAFKYVLILLIAASSVGGAAGQNDQTPITKFLSLASIAAAIQSASKQKDRANDPATRNQYLAVYSQLQTIKTDRASYLNCMDLYIDSVELNVSKRLISKRANALLNQARVLSGDLVVLNTDLGPLRLRLNLSQPELKKRVYDYQQSQDAKTRLVVDGGQDFLDTLRTADLEKLRRDIAENGTKLDLAIADLEQLLKSKYPDLGQK